MYDIDPVQYGQLLGDITRLKEDIKTGNITIKELSDRLDQLEERANQNDRQHIHYDTQLTAINRIEESLKKIEDGTFYVDRSKAKADGTGWVQLLVSNPKYLLWTIIGVVSALMVLMGYSLTEILNVLKQLQ